VCLITPCAWIPDSWANALWPTSGFATPTGMPLNRSTSWESSYRRATSIPVSYSYKASSARTSSSKLAFPDRSPSPFTQVWGTWTPSSTAARLFATARPKSLCPWNESSVGTSRSFSCPKNQRIPGGVITPTVSQTTARCAPAFVHALYRSTTKSRSARNVDLIEEPCDLDLLLGRECDTWSLFSVSQGLLPNAHPLGDPAREARFNQVVVDEAFLRDGCSP